MKKQYILAEVLKAMDELDALFEEQQKELNEKMNEFPGMFKTLFVKNKNSDAIPLINAVLAPVFYNTAMEEVDFEELSAYRNPRRDVK